MQAKWHFQFHFVAPKTNEVMNPNCDAKLIRFQWKNIILFGRKLSLFWVAQAFVNAISEWVTHSTQDYLLIPSNNLCKFVCWESWRKSQRQILKRHLKFKANISSCAQAARKFIELKQKCAALKGFKFVRLDIITFPSSPSIQRAGSNYQIEFIFSFHWVKNYY